MTEEFFKYCPRCGGKAQQERRSGQDVPVCQDSACGFILWQNSKPCVVALIANSAGRILMTVRGMAPEEHKLDLPGGFLTNGEWPEDGLRREVAEELGVRVEVGHYLGHHLDAYPYQGNREFVLTMGFAARIIEGTPSVHDREEIASIEWIDPVGATTARLAFTGNEEFLRRWLATQIGV